MLGTAADVLVRPGEVFAGPDVPGLGPAVVIVLASALPTAATAVVLLLQFRHLLPQRPLAIAVAFSAVAISVVGVVGWVLAAAVLYLLSWPFADDGEFRDLLAGVGWGFLPQVIASLVVLAAALVAVTRAPAPADEAAARTFARQLDSGSLIRVAAAAGTAQATASGSLSQIQAVAGVVGALWTGYVWVPAVERFRGLSRRQAVLVVAVPVLFMVVNGL